MAITSALSRIVVGAALILTPSLSAQRQQPKIPDDTEIKTTDSGLKYSVLTPGRGGLSPKLGSKVTVHYTGWLTDGTMFDTSRTRGVPTTFTLGQVIDGWNEALQLMTAGARFKLTIPPELGYGKRGSPPRIPGDSTLIFDVQLLSFKAPRAATPTFGPLDPKATKTTDSGLKYQVLEAGSGDNAKETDIVEFDYAMWNTKGRLLQSSTYLEKAQKGSPKDFPMAVLKEALTMMKPGARFRFEVPPKLAFGERNNGDHLPPNSITIWEFNLLAITKPLAVPEFVNPKPEDLKKTDSGLQYQVIEAGAGESPKRGQKNPVKVHYAGWTPDGKLFDSSFSRGEPSSFQIGQVIEGWNEGLELMKPGAKFRFVIPPNLAYGERGSPPVIGPNATLIFYVHLIE